MKDIVRRGRFYRGFVVYRRGAEERPGRHLAIIDETTWAVARQGIDARAKGTARPSSRRRVYLLSGIIECGCGARLHGQTRSSRGGEWRYYLCRHCHNSSIVADDAETEILNRLRELLLPPAAVEMAREELRRRLALPARGAADEARARLETRLGRLKAQFEWGDIEEGEYRAKLEETRAHLVLLPEADKLVSFDRVAGIVSSLAAAIDAASPAQLKDLVRMLVHRVTTARRAVASIEIVPAALPFFAPQITLLGAPPDGLEPPTQALGRPRSIH